jgi:hypothetical protein
MGKKLTIEEVKERIKEIYGDTITLDESTYINTQIKAWFIDKEFGRWQSIPNNILRGHGHIGHTREKRKKTCVKIFGVEYPTQSEKIKEKTKQTCIKKYGVMCPLQSESVQEKTRKTCLKKYGVSHPSQSN